MQKALDIIDESQTKHQKTLGNRKLQEQTGRTIGYESRAEDQKVGRQCEIIFELKSKLFSLGIPCGFFFTIFHVEETVNKRLPTAFPTVNTRHRHTNRTISHHNFTIIFRLMSIKTIIGLQIIIPANGRQFKPRVVHSVGNKRSLNVSPDFNPSVFAWSSFLTDRQVVRLCLSVRSHLGNYWVTFEEFDELQVPVRLSDHILDMLVTVAIGID